jgi:hypothetical protein
VAALSVVVPRFSTTAFVLGARADRHRDRPVAARVPTLGSLWETNYGKALVVKIVLLFARSRWRGQSRADEAAARGGRVRPSDGPGRRCCSRRLVQGEILFVAGALFAAAVLTASRPGERPRPREEHRRARRPGPVSTVIDKGPYKIHVQVTPNRAAVNNSFRVTVTKNGQPVRGARSSRSSTCSTWRWARRATASRQTRPGSFSKSAPRS